MSEVARNSNDRPFSEIIEALTHKATWFWVIGFFAALIVSLYKPFVWEFTLLCCFPAPLFCYGAIRSGAIHRPGMMKIVIIVAVVHCVLLATTLYLWREFPQNITGDFGFGFVAIEVALIALLMRFARQGSSRAAQQ